MSANDDYVIFALSGCTRDDATPVRAALSEMKGFADFNVLDMANNLWCVMFHRQQVALLSDEELDGLVIMRLAPFPGIRAQRTRFT